MKKLITKPERKSDEHVKQVSYIALLGLAGLLLYGVWVSDPDRQAGSSLFFSGRTMDIVITACLVVTVMAMGYAAFIILRAFYRGLTEDESKKDS